MKTVTYSIFALFLFVLSLIVSSYSQNGNDETFSGLVKVALRNTGNSLLLQSNDSTSLVLPVIETEQRNFQLSFQTQLFIIPDSLVAAIKKNVAALNLPNEYLVEVIDCNSQEVSYSYSVSNSEEKNIIPCLGRNLPLSCYTIHVSFNKSTVLLGLSLGASWYALVLLGIMGVALLYWTKKKQETKVYDTLPFETIGDYRFYKNQNELVKNDLNIKLTSKESELLQIFCANQNQVVKRDFLLKEVWENKGVFVGRSLDTFISKLRKKFKDDNHINILNIHGVGYKLEIVKKPKR
ncbi:winged helix-turn-helix domain-containing protein [Allomuricauda sp. SCSIO 65647]|uniref:winged helix-turn-helix domain-containing protein n=1 Tax=Allomuricauda sp. SCSIO 65647 TaxID=2908843 RepID=UPI001F43F5C6|nr:winged helix-turn-helix domain-containing protein [Muricauda sp. SCSIO 65647]UJH68980.1 winged helix-turn-helix domain-containing protein [Muricauda sp. SCSIO 65647]